ncbi:MAG: hypothetical protein ACTSYC_01795 [Promethearchaeota archaeon]
MNEIEKEKIFRYLFNKLSFISQKKWGKKFILHFDFDGNVYLVINPQELDINKCST